MKTEKPNIGLEIASTKARCPVGETVGRRGIEQSKIPVLSCEGACIRGEIARQAANLVAREAPYGRGCHGELLTVPDSAIARWIKTARKVVLIDGCFLRCHGRMLESVLQPDRLAQFDALAVYKKYTDVFDVDDVSEAERMAAARQVADHVLARLAREDETDRLDFTPRQPLSSQADRTAGAPWTPTATHGYGGSSSRSATCRSRTARGRSTGPAATTSNCVARSNRC